MVPSEVTGRMPGRTGVRTPRASRSRTSPSYSEASKKNWVTPKSASSSLAARKSRSLPVLGRAGMPGRVGRHPDREAADGPGQLDQLDGVGQLTGPGLGIGGRVAAERHEVLDAGLAQRDQDVGQLQPGVGHADEMRHRVERRRVQHAAHQVERALPRGRAAAVGHRDEGGAERLELADGAGQGGRARRRSSGGRTRRSTSARPPAGRRSASRRAPGIRPAEVVLEPDDVVLAEVGPVLHLDEDDVGPRPRWPPGGPPRSGCRWPARATGCARCRPGSPAPGPTRRTSARPAGHGAGSSAACPGAPRSA